jgi:hypothetical protein
MKAGWKNRIDERIYFEEKKAKHDYYVALLNKIRFHEEHLRMENEAWLKTFVLRQDVDLPSILSAAL